MERLLILICFCCLSHLSIGQVGYCDYFKLSIEKSIYEGKEGLSIVPEIVSIPGDSLSDFILKHANRFQYIIYNRLDSLNRYSQLFPDSVAIQNLFCSNIRKKKINNYFRVLAGHSQEPEIYTKGEMMRIASRFFLCDRVNESDTTIGYHICIGINGQEELQSERDYTTLEAFCFEAIFDSYKDGRPQFTENFNRYIENSSIRRKRNFKDFKSFLESVKEDCFTEMEDDDTLKKSLLDFYNLNKNNISIEII